MNRFARLTSALIWASIATAAAASPAADVCGEVTATDGSQLPSTAAVVRLTKDWVGSLQHFLKSGITVIVLANRDLPAAESIAVFAAHRLPAD